LVADRHDAGCARWTRRDDAGAIEVHEVRWLIARDETVWRVEASGDDGTIVARPVPAMP
jgi:hypothetical protein